MEETIIKWHDYSEISKYSYKDGRMLFEYEVDGQIGYLIGSWSYDGYYGQTKELRFRGGGIYKMRIIRFALFSEFEEI